MVERRIAQEEIGKQTRKEHRGGCQAPGQEEAQPKEEVGHDMEGIEANVSLNMESEEVVELICIYI